MPIDSQFWQLYLLENESPSMHNNYSCPFNHVPIIDEYSDFIATLNQYTNGNNSYAEFTEKDISFFEKQSSYLNKILETSFLTIII